VLVADAAPAAKALAVSPPRPAVPAPDLTSAEAAAVRAAAEANMQQSRDERRSAREEKFGEHSRQYLILAATAWILLLSAAAIVFLFVRLRRSQSSPQTEGAKTEDASAAAMVDPFYSRLAGIIPRIDATAAAKSQGYQSGGRVRVFFQTRASAHSAAGSTLQRIGYAPR
jgi:hypothetical protein